MPLGRIESKKVGNAIPNPRDKNIKAEIVIGCDIPQPIAAPIYGPVHGVATITVKKPNRKEFE